MSIELNPLILEYCGTSYHVFPNVCEEHPDQIDFVLVVRLRDGKEKAHFAPNKAWNGLERQALSTAYEQRSRLESQLQADDGCVIDYAEIISA